MVIGQDRTEQVGEDRVHLLGAFEEELGAGTQQAHLELVTDLVLVPGQQFNRILNMLPKIAYHLNHGTLRLLLFSMLHQRVEHVRQHLEIARVQSQIVLDYGKDVVAQIRLSSTVYSPYDILYDELCLLLLGTQQVVVEDTSSL